jgi:hypothetical protein
LGLVQQRNLLAAKIETSREKGAGTSENSSQCYSKQLNVFKMENFSIADCELYWDTRIKISKRDQQELKKEIKTLASTTGKAILFLKEAASDGNEPVVTFLLGGNSEFELSLWETISAETVQQGEDCYFEMNIQNKSDSCVAFFSSEKYKIIRGFLEEEAEFFELDVIK